MAGFNWNGGNATGMDWNNMMPAQNGIQQMPMSITNGNVPVQNNNRQVYYIPGRSVNSFDEIKAGDVPMNVPFSIFPLADMSKVCIKYWGADGRIETMIYGLESDSTGNNIPKDPQIQQMPVQVIEDLDSLKKQLGRIESMIRKSNRPKNKPAGGKE